MKPEQGKIHPGLLRLRETRRQAASGIGSVEDQFFHRKRRRKFIGDLIPRASLSNQAIHCAKQTVDIASGDKAPALQIENNRLLKENTALRADLERATEGSYIRVMKRFSRARMAERDIMRAEASQRSPLDIVRRGMERFFDGLGNVVVRAMEIMAETPQIDPASGVYLTQIPRTTKS